MMSDDDGLGTFGPPDMSHGIHRGIRSSENGALV
jgi:hypothetical protein